MINMIAGADTTAITMRAVFYYGLKNPEVWARLEGEVLASSQHRPDAASPLSLKEARRLPYLDAIIREAMRIHPGVGMSLERYVPPEGLRLPNGQFVPASCVVGINPWVVHRNAAVFGADPDAFRPERWLRDYEGEETEEAYQTRLRRMNQADLTFGAGSRVCIGKHISTMEVLKVVPSLISQFRFELDDPTSEWNVVNSFFVRQTGLKVRIQRR
jgi:cytochrome P450